MSDLVGRLIGDVAGRAMAEGIRNSRRRAALAHWHSPLSRLGRCGIISLRVDKALEESLRAVTTAGMPAWGAATGVRLDPRTAGPARLLVLAGDGVALIEALVGPECAGAVRSVDAAAEALSARLGPGRPVHRFVCEAETRAEPRDLPGPSGRPVTVTGLPWLAGALRARLGNEPGTAAPAELDGPVAAARWRADRGYLVSRAALRRFTPQGWWVIPNLYLDDGDGDVLDVVLAGPPGVVVADLAAPGDDHAVERVGVRAGRLRAYLPHVDVIPMIVSESVREPRFGPADPAGYPIAWVRPDAAIAFLESVRRRGPGPHELGVLNAPAPGWTRQVTIRPDLVHTRYGWC